MEIDTKGMNCPLPILKAKKAMNQIETTTSFSTAKTHVQTTTPPPK